MGERMSEIVEDRFPILNDKYREIYTVQKLDWDNIKDEGKLEEKEKELANILKLLERL